MTKAELITGNVLLTATIALGCSGRVDLGERVQSHQPVPTTNGVEIAAQTSSVLSLSDANFLGIALDEAYLYFDLKPQSNSSYDKYVLKRCSKVDCWRTLSTLRTLGWIDSGIGIYAHRLGWVNEDGLQLCSIPDCRDAQVAPDVVVETGYGTFPIAWTADSIYWYLQTDGAMYRCDEPNCQGGARNVASQTAVTDIELVDDKVYWLDMNQGILRTRSDGTQAKERLTLESETIWTPNLLDTATTVGCHVFAMQVTGSWIYAAMAPDNWPGCGIPCVGCGTINALMRWRTDEVGAERQAVLVNDSDFEDLAFLRIFENEVVWAVHGGNLWSCLADDCAATKRQIGVEATLNRAAKQSVVADAEYLYWLSNACDGNGECSPVWNLKRTPRLIR